MIVTVTVPRTAWTPRGLGRAGIGFPVTVPVEIGVGQIGWGAETPGRPVWDYS